MFGGVFEEKLGPEMINPWAFEWKVQKPRWVVLEVTLETGLVPRMDWVGSRLLEQEPGLG